MPELQRIADGRPRDVAPKRNAPAPASTTLETRSKLSEPGTMTNSTLSEPTPAPCNLAGIPGHDCNEDACGPAEAQDHFGDVNEEVDTASEDMGKDGCGSALTPGKAHGNISAPAIPETAHERLKALRAEWRHAPNLTLSEFMALKLAAAEKMKDCVWVKPELVAEIEFLEWTDANHIRHTSFVGLKGKHKT
jgi:hypothetical protein